MKKIALFITILILISVVLVGSGCLKKKTPTKEYEKEIKKEKTVPVGPICGDGKIDAGETCSTCPKDVKCKSDEECVSGVCKKLCGNGKVDSGETCSNCPADVKCKSDEKCQEGKCVLKEAEYKFNIYAVTPMSTGVLYFDTKFYRSFTGKDWAKVKVYKTGKAAMKNAKLTVDFGNWADKFTKSLGDLGSKTVYLTPKLNTNALVKSRITKQVKFKLEYYDSKGKKHTETKTKSIVLLPPQYVTMRETMFTALWSEKRYAPFLQFYDSRIKSLAQDLTRGAGSANEARAKAIFDGLASRGLYYEKEPDKKFQLTYYTDYEEKTKSANFEYVKFPYQTYTEKGGDCEDMAILMGSLLQSIGINSYLILWDKPDKTGHSFLSFNGDSGSTVRIEPTHIGKYSYETAVRRGAEEWEQARKGWWGSIIIRKVFDKSGVRKLPVQ